MGEGERILWFRRVHLVRFFLTAGLTEKQVVELLGCDMWCSTEGLSRF